MLFLPDSIYEERRRLLKDLDRNKIQPVKVFQRMLDLDPDDDVALRQLGVLADKSGDAAAAEDYFWRSLNKQPCAWTTYLALSHGPGESSDGSALSMGLAELALRKLALNAVDLDEFFANDVVFGFKETGDFEDISKVERLEVLADEMRRSRDLEPAAVTAKLRPYRLIHILQEGSEVDDRLVDAIVAEGPAIVPLLVGVLRAWCRNYLPDDSSPIAENALALLGEIGDSTVIPHLLEFVTVEDRDIRGAAEWALDRIAEVHPDQFAGVASEIISGLNAGERMSVLEKLVRFPKIDPSGGFFIRLGEDLSGIPKEDLEEFFPSLLSAMMFARGSAGVEMARTALRRNVNLLPRDIRAACEELIEVLGSVPLPAPPAAKKPEYSIYDICAGEVVWKDDEEDFGEKELDDLPPEPIHKAPKPGRNEPCWCGSEKKYKKCHQEADEQLERTGAIADLRLPAEFDNLRRRLGMFLTEAPTESERREATVAFSGLDQPDGDKQMAITDWMVHDWISPRWGHNLIEEFVRRWGAGLRPRELEVLKSWSSSFTSLYEVQEVKTGTGVTLRNVFTDETLFVHDISMSKVLARWDGLLARVVDGERGLEFGGNALSVPRVHFDGMRDWLEEDNRRSRLPWPEYSKKNLPRIRRQLAHLYNEWRSGLRLQNTDGDELLWSKAIYRVVDLPALIRALEATFEVREAGARYTWLGSPKQDEGATVLGNLRIEDGQLVIECNSKSRLQRGKKLLMAAAGRAVEYLSQEFIDQVELLRRAPEDVSSAPSEIEEIPTEVQHKLITEVMEKHFAKWPDTPLPALDGKTARQAVKNLAGRRKVSALLRDLENSEEHKRLRGKPFYDISRLRNELGLKD
jgi:hypothetical protein